MVFENKRFRRTQLFRGFSSIDKRRPDTELSDIELVKRDLLNHFHTVPGERVMRPQFGSMIWDLLFEPFDADTREAVISDAINIISQEPRVELQTIDVLEFEHGLRLNIAVLYVPFNAIQNFEIDFDRRNNIQESSQIAAEEL